MKDYIKTFKEHFNMYHFTYAVCFVLFLNKLFLLPMETTEEMITTAIAYMIYIAIQAFVTYTLLCLIYFLLDKYDQK